MAAGRKRSRTSGGRGSAARADESFDVEPWPVLKREDDQGDSTLWPTAPSMDRSGASPPRIRRGPAPLRISHAATHWSLQPDPRGPEPPSLPTIDVKLIRPTPYECLQQTLKGVALRTEARLEAIREREEQRRIEEEQRRRAEEEMRQRAAQERRAREERERQLREERERRRREEREQRRLEERERRQREERERRQREDERRARIHAQHGLAGRGGSETADGDSTSFAAEGPSDELLAEMADLLQKRAEALSQGADPSQGGGAAVYEEAGDGDQYEAQRREALRQNQMLLQKLGLVRANRRKGHEGGFLSLNAGDEDDTDGEGDDDAGRTTDAEDDDEDFGHDGIRMGGGDDAPRPGRRGRPPKKSRREAASDAGREASGTMPASWHKPQGPRMHADGTTSSLPPRGQSYEVAYVQAPNMRERIRASFVVRDADVPALPEWFLEEQRRQRELEEQERQAAIARAAEAERARAEAEKAQAEAAAASSSKVAKAKKTKKAPKEAKATPTAKAKSFVKRVGPVGEGDDEQGSTCHQCRRKTLEPKMRCRHNEGSAVCVLLWCRGCIEKRYSFDFDVDSRSFICPRCSGYCNCSLCLRKAGMADLVPNSPFGGKTLSSKLRDESGQLVYRSVHEYIMAIKGIGAWGTQTALRKASEAGEGTQRDADDGAASGVAQEADAEGDAALQAAPSPPKRKRGRPRKSAQPDPGSVVEASEVAAKSATRPIISGKVVINVNGGKRTCRLSVRHSIRPKDKDRAESGDSKTGSIATGKTSSQLSAPSPRHPPQTDASGPRKGKSRGSSTLALAAEGDMWVRSAAELSDDSDLTSVSASDAGGVGAAEHHDEDLDDEDQMSMEDVGERTSSRRSSSSELTWTSSDGDTFGSGVIERVSFDRAAAAASPGTSQLDPSTQGVPVHTPHFSHSDGRPVLPDLLHQGHGGVSVEDGAAHGATQPFRGESAWHGRHNGDLSMVASDGADHGMSYGFSGHVGAHSAHGDPDIVGSAARPHNGDPLRPHNGDHAGPAPAWVGSTVGLAATAAPHFAPTHTWNPTAPGVFAAQPMPWSDAAHSEAGAAVHFRTTDKDVASGKNLDPPHAFEAPRDGPGDEGGNAGDTTILALQWLQQQRQHNERERDQLAAQTHAHGAS